MNQETDAPLEKCDDHADLGKWYTYYQAKVLLKLLSKVLWGFRVIIVPPCVERAQLQEQAIAAALAKMTPQQYGQYN